MSVETGTPVSFVTVMKITIIHLEIKEPSRENWSRDLGLYNHFSGQPTVNWKKNFFRNRAYIAKRIAKTLGILPIYLADYSNEIVQNLHYGPNVR